MLYSLSGYLALHVYSGFHVFHYLTLRAILGVLTALMISWIIGPLMIRKLQLLRIGQQIRQDGPQSHLLKAGTPTMGGALILISVVLSTILWGALDNRYLWLALAVTVATGILGGIDDGLKLKFGNSRGLSAKSKFLWQSLIAFGVAFYLFYTATIPQQTDLLVPFAKHLLIGLGWLFIPLTWLVIVGSSNAVNLTDGLDGLAILPTVLVAGALAIFAYVGGNFKFADYLGLPYIPGVGELAIFCGALVGGGLGFLWFNTYPAQVFMGDVGALSLGSALGLVAVLVRQEIILMIMGGVFVVETLSVVLQVTSFKLTGKRIFQMAPLHHHFELKGWPEPRVIVRFWIITVVLVLIGLASLKVR